MKNETNLSVNYINDILIINISGKIDASNSEVISNNINKIIGNNKNLILDLYQLEYISSAGLRVFLSIVKKSKNYDGQVIFCNISNNIKELFDITGLTNVFILCNSLDEAIKKITI